MFRALHRFIMDVSIKQYYWVSFNLKCNIIERFTNEGRFLLLAFYFYAVSGRLRSNVMLKRPSFYTWRRQDKYSSW